LPKIIGHQVLDLLFISERIWEDRIGFLFLPEVINFFAAEIIYCPEKESMGPL
jgi:hypothetical protein